MLERVWEGRTVVLMATGPSLTYDQCFQVALRHEAQGLIVAGCNDAYRAYRGLDLLYAADDKWWIQNLGAVKQLGIPELYVPIEEHAQKHEIGYMRGKGGAVLSTNPDHINYASHSGFQLFNIAFLRGAKRIVLLGYDYTYTSPERAHFFGAHENPLRNPPPKMANWVGAYASSLEILREAGVEVLNCSPVSLIKCFPKVGVEEALQVA